MKMNAITRIAALASLAVGFVTLGVVSGCDTGTPKLDEKHLEKTTEDAFAMRAIFDSVKGDWDKLSAEDQKKFIDAWGGDETRAKAQWEYMKNPAPRGGPVVNQPK